MFKTRLLSGILLVIIALATIISGDYVLFFHTSCGFSHWNERIVQSNEGAG